LKFDPDAAAAAGSGIYGLPFKPEESKVVVIPVPRRGDHHVKAVNKISEDVNRWVYDKTASFLNDGKMPVVLGGDHSVPFGAIRAVDLSQRDHPSSDRQTRAGRDRRAGPLRSRAWRDRMGRQRRRAVAV